MRTHPGRAFLLVVPLSLGLGGCGLVWDWTHRGVLRRDMAALLEGQSVAGRVRACAMEGMTRAGACLWEAQSRDVDDLVRVFAMEEKSPDDRRERWRPVSRCRRLGRDPRSRVYGLFSGAGAWKLSSGQTLQSLLAYVPAGGGDACLQASFAKP